ncbi:MAG: GGDEF domain-containing protein [Burkholderiales bacterium]|nr:GGDEF domain-containing protein [Burkholderiales bacterium]
MSIERSTELLRLALPWMSRQRAGLHPVSYAVWFDYVAQTNPPLRAAIDEQLAREGALDEFATQALFTRHVADVDPDTAQRVVDHMQRVLGGIGESAGATGAHAARYAATLAQLAAALVRGDTAGGIQDPAGLARNVPAPRQLADVVAEVIADTGTMRSQIGGLQQRLADSRREIERLRDEVRRAREDALRDSLTGLSNRRAFDQALAALLTAPASPSPAVGARDARAAIDAAKTPAASRPPAVGPAPLPAGDGRGPWLLVTDIDRFGRVNEAHGREFGDQVIKAVAEALLTLVPAGATLARVDGEAFGLLAPGLDAAAALLLADRVRAHIGSARIHRPGREDTERVTLSVGLARARDGEAPQGLLERAGAALRQAKAAGRDRVVSAG